jgi:hypothetical protein
VPSLPGHERLETVVRYSAPAGGIRSRPWDDRRPGPARPGREEDILAEPSRPHHPERLQTLVLRHLVALARTQGPRRGATVFEVEVADVTRALRRGTRGPGRASEPRVRRALEDLMGPESVIPPGPPRLDVLPCDGLGVPERYRVMFSGDPGLVEPPDDGT